MILQQLQLLEEEDYQDYNLFEQLDQPKLGNLKKKISQDGDNIAQLTYAGLEFYFESDIKIYFNFGNPDLSKFTFNFSKINFLEQGPL